MRNILSILSCLLIGVALVQYRVSNSDVVKDHAPLKITEWDAFGYYIYLPALCIYHDHKELKWLDSTDAKYHVTGGNGWQAMKADNGKYVFKYLGGVALLELPLFLAGHTAAKAMGYPPDGFSPPYQYALGFGIIVYCLLAVLVLRKILLRYFSDSTTALTLLLVCLATNFLQYAGVDSGQSHAYLFVLYILVLYTTIRWHEKPTLPLALFTGYIVGLATMTRPTEAIMLFIPLLWNTHTHGAAREKWASVRQHKTHIAAALAGGFLGILPQLLYWKNTAGSFIFDVGSKWDFLSPHFRVLFGWEKGWFIYTPVTLFFIAGMFFMKHKPFRKSVLWFCFLNIYIIVGWHEWRYGGSYSTRALVQSYPVFALPFASLVERINASKVRILFYALCAYLLVVNLFQVCQYNKTILHYDDMNRKYYAAIYLNPHPTPEDMSLLDNDILIRNEKSYKSGIVAWLNAPVIVTFPASNDRVLLDTTIGLTPDARFIKTVAFIHAPGCLWQTFIETSVTSRDKEAKSRARLFSPISKDSSINRYAFFTALPDEADSIRVRVRLSSAFDFKGTVRQLKIVELAR